MRRQQKVPGFITLVSRFLRWTGLLVLFLWALKNAGNYLVVSDPLEPAEVIVVLGGELERVDWAVTLYREGYAPYIILSGAARRMGYRAVSRGVPWEALILEDEARSTYENAVFCRRIILEQGFRSAIVVSSPYHMRRSKFTFEKVFAGSGVKLIYSPAENSWFEPRHWWRRKNEWRVVVKEYLKLLWYAVRY